jgi:TonB family protein
LTSLKDTLFLAISLGLHALLLLLTFGMAHPAAPPQVAILSVETVSGATPRGEGSGAPGEKKAITDAPANPQPVPGSFKLNPAEMPRQKQAKKAASRSKVKVRQAPSLDQLAQEHAQMPIGLQPRSDHDSEDLSEGGMGEGRQAGAPGGQPQVSGPIGGRGFRPIDWNFPHQLPEESTLRLAITVAPNGLVKSARLLQASGYADIDQNAVSRAKDLIFDPLPAGSEQVDTEGILSFNFQFNR